MHVSSAYDLVSRLARVHFPFCLCLAFADVRSGHLMEDRPPFAGHTFLRQKDHRGREKSTPNLDDYHTIIKTVTSRSHRCAEIPSLVSRQRPRSTTAGNVQRSSFLPPQGQRRESCSLPAPAECLCALVFPKLIGAVPFSAHC